MSLKMQSSTYLAMLLFTAPIGLTAHSAPDDQPDVSMHGRGGYRGGGEAGRGQSPATRNEEQNWRRDTNAYGNYPGGGGVNVEYTPPYNPYGTDPNEQGTTWDDSSYSQLQKEGP